MSFFSNIIGATVKTVLTPVAIIKDTVKVAVGEEPNSTKKLIESAQEDIKQATDDLADGNI